MTVSGTTSMSLWHPKRAVSASVLALVAGAGVLAGLAFLETTPVAIGLAPLAVPCGAAILAGAALMILSPRRHAAAGLLVTVTSAIALGGYAWWRLGGLAAILGIAAGVMAIVWEPPAVAESAPAKA